MQEIITNVNYKWDKYFNDILYQQGIHKTLHNVTDKQINKVLLIMAIVVDQKLLSVKVRKSD